MCVFEFAGIPFRTQRIEGHSPCTVLYPWHCLLIQQRQERGQKGVDDDGLVVRSHMQHLHRRSSHVLQTPKLKKFLYVQHQMPHKHLINSDILNGHSVAHSIAKLSFVRNCAH